MLFFFRFSSFFFYFLLSCLDVFVCIVRMQCVARCLSVCHLNQSDQNGMWMGFSFAVLAAYALTEVLWLQTRLLLLPPHRCRCPCSRSVQLVPLLQSYPHYYNSFLHRFARIIVGTYVHMHTNVQIHVNNKCIFRTYLAHTAQSQNYSIHS